MSNQQRQGFLFIFIAVSGYACFPILAKQIQQSGLPSLDIATWRFLFAMIVFWAIIFFRRIPPSTKPLPRGRLVLLGALLASAAVTALWGLERLPAGAFILLFYTYPAMVALISLFLGERLTQRAWSALGLTLIGVALTTPDFSAGFSSANGVGLLLALVNALIVALYFVLNNRLLRQHTALMRASAWTISGSFLAILVVSALRGLRLPPDTVTWAYLLAMAIFSTVMPVFALTIGLNKLGASRAAIASTLEPVLTAILAAVFLGERLQPIQLVGGALILASVVLLQMPQRAARRDPAPLQDPAG